MRCGADGDEMFRAKFIASGNVQGVGFRNFACRIGKSCGLAGYAKNLHDGTVEIVAEGDGEKIAELARRVSVRMHSGIHVERLEEVEKRKINSRSFASFGVEY